MYVIVLSRLTAIRFFSYSVYIFLFLSACDILLVCAAMKFGINELWRCVAAPVSTCILSQLDPLFITFHDSLSCSQKQGVVHKHQCRQE